MPRTLFHSLAAAALIACFASAAAAQSSPVVVEAWARATPSGAKDGAAYVTLSNKGSEADRLLSASTPAAAVTQLHTTINDNGVMKMRPIDGVDLPAGGTVTFKPGGMHIMLIGLKAPLVQGKTIPLTLTFAKAGKIETTVKIAKIGAMSGMNMPGMDMPGGTMNKGGMNMEDMGQSK